MASVSASLDNVLLKINRPIAACSRCRTAKIKCDGQLPACGACERAGKATTCSGASDEFAKGKERSYVSALEAQCERLHKNLQDVLQKVALQQQESAGIQALPAPGMERKTQRKEASDVDELVGDFGFLSVQHP